MRAADLNWRGGRPELNLNIFHPTRDDVFVIGLIQPDSGQFGLVHYQAELVANYVAGLDAGSAAAFRFQQAKRGGATTHNGGVRYVNSPRHWFEVEHHSYRRALEKSIANLH